MRGSILIPLLCVVLASCASSSDDIAPNYISPLQYQYLSCQQIAAEAQRVSHRASVLAGAQDSKATNDAVATGVGIVLFWPALFFIKGDSQTAAELGRLRGEFDALDQAAIQKNCGLQFRQQPKPPPPQTTSSIPPPY